MTAADPSIIGPAHLRMSANQNLRLEYAAASVAALRSTFAKL
jgi:hypothetical protein